MKTRTKPATVTVGIPADAHKLMKAKAAARKMKLREYPRYLLVLADIVTPEQETEAYLRFVGLKTKPAA